MRFLSMIRIDEKGAQAPSERLMTDMGKLIEDMTRDGTLVRTAGLRPTAEGKRMRWRRGALSITDEHGHRTNETRTRKAPRFTRSLFFVFDVRVRP